MAYRIVLAPDDNDTVLITSPAFPELTSFADSREEAPSLATLALEEAVAARMARGLDIPEPDFEPEEILSADWADLSLQTMIKVALYKAQREAGVTRAEMARRLGWRREQVDRLFRPDHASRLDQLQQGFAVLNKTIIPHIQPRIAA